MPSQGPIAVSQSPRTVGVARHPSVSSHASHTQSLASTPMSAHAPKRESFSVAVRGPGTGSGDEQDGQSVQGILRSPNVFTKTTPKWCTPSNAFTNARRTSTSTAGAGSCATTPTRDGLDVGKVTASRRGSGGSVMSPSYMNSPMGIVGEVRQSTSSLHSREISSANVSCVASPAANSAPTPSHAQVALSNVSRPPTASQPQLSPRAAANQRLSGTFGVGSPFALRPGSGKSSVTRPGSSMALQGSPRLHGPPAARRVDPHNPPSPSASARSGVSSRSPNMNPLRRVASPTSRNVSPQQRAPDDANAANEATVKLQWKKGKFLGAGAFGKVYLGLNLATGRLMAVKTIDFAAGDKGVVAKLQALQQEIRMMKGLQHENVVAYLCTERIGSTINIFMEFVPGGSIASVLAEFGPLSEPTAQNYLRQIVLALEYLHANNVIHRDIKAANVLLNVHGVCKISDFGTASKIDDLRKQGSKKGASAMLGTPAWMAPEVIREEEIGKPSDIWSLAATCLEILTAKQPFAHITTNTLKLMATLASHEPLPSLPSFEDDSLNGFLHACLQKNPANRPSSSDLLNTFTFFDQAEDQSLMGSEDDEGDASFDQGSQVSVNTLNRPSPGLHGLRIPGFARNNSDVSAHSAGTRSHAATPLHGTVDAQGRFDRDDGEMDLMSMPNTEVIAMSHTESKHEDLLGLGLEDTLSQRHLHSPTSPNLRLSPRQRRRRNPHQAMRGLTVDVGTSSISSKRSFVAPTVMTPWSPPSTRKSVPNPAEANRIGRHLIGSCISLMNIVPKVEIPNDDDGTATPSTEDGVVTAFKDHPTLQGLSGVTPKGGPPSGIHRLSGYLRTVDAEAEAVLGDPETSTVVDVEAELVDKITAHAFSDPKECMVSKVDPPWLPQEEETGRASLTGRSLEGDPHLIHDKYFFCCQIATIEDTKTATIVVLSLLSLALAILLVLKSM